MTTATITVRVGHDRLAPHRHEDAVTTECPTPQGRWTIGPETVDLERLSPQARILATMLAEYHGTNGRAVIESDLPRGEHLAAHGTERAEIDRAWSTAQQAEPHRASVGLVWPLVCHDVDVHDWLESQAQRAGDGWHFTGAWA